MSAFELGRIGIENPEYVAVAIGAAVAGLTADRWETNRESDLAHTNAEAGLVVASPDIAQPIEDAARRTRTVSRVGYCAAVGLVSFTAAIYAHPYSMHSEMKGGATEIIPAGYSGDVADVQTDGKKTTRLQASVAGGLAAAHKNDEPFSFIVSGDTDPTVDTTPAKDKDLAKTEQRIYAALTPHMRNNDPTMAEAVTNALPHATAESNNIIMIAPNLSEKDQSRLRDINQTIQKHYPGNRLRAVVVGNGQGNYQVAGETLTSATNPQSFTDVIGAKNVKTAKSSEDVEQAISAFVNETDRVEAKRAIGLFKDGAILSAITLAGVAAYRRLSGLNPRSKSNKGRK